MNGQKLGPLGSILHDVISWRSECRLDIVGEFLYLASGPFRTVESSAIVGLFPTGVQEGGNPPYHNPSSTSHVLRPKKSIALIPAFNALGRIYV